MRRSIQRVIVLTVLTLVSTVYTSLVLAAPQYSIIDLGTLGNYYTEARAINNQSQVVGGSCIGPETHAFLWGDTNHSGQSDPGEMQDMGTLSHDRATAYGVNGLGQACGESRNNTDIDAFYWDSTTGMIEIQGFGGYTSAYGINNNKQVVGTGYFGNGYTNPSRGFVWHDNNGNNQSDPGETVAIGTFGGDHSGANGINNRGEICGYAEMSGFSSGYGTRAFFRSSGGSMINLGGLQASGSYSEAKGINKKGQVTGYSANDNYDWEAFIWEDRNGNGQSDPGEMQGLGSGEFEHSLGQAINNNSQVVGYLFGNPNIEGYNHAFVWDKDWGIVDLDDLITPESGWKYLEMAWGINDVGQIVGMGYTSDGGQHAFLLTPVSKAGWCYSGGIGTASAPYQIATKEDLLMLAANTNDYDKCFILTADIDLVDEVFTQALIAPDTSTNDSWEGTRFTGVFDGNGHVIRNLTIAASGRNHIGLFGLLGPGGEVKNLSMKDVAIEGQYGVGGLVGNNEGTITSCYATGMVSGMLSAGGLVGQNYYGNITFSYATGKVVGTDSCNGGLVGYNSGNIISCQATGDVSGTDNIGGLVGINNGTITSCYATGAVRGYDAVGGLVGETFDNTTIASSCATGTVRGRDCVGGLVGYSMGGITFSYTTGAVKGRSAIGGLAGCNFDNITSCYATGAVRGYNTVGGLVGQNDSNNGGTIDSCYATGVISGTEEVGGLVGKNYNYYSYDSITFSFWNTETSGQATSDGGEGMTTAQMMAMNTFTDADWDFSDTDGDAADWKTPVTEWYPILSWQQTEDEFSITSMSVKAGKRTPDSPGDSFVIKGDSFDIDAGAIAQAEAVEFSFYNEGETEPCLEGTIPFEPWRCKKGKYNGKNAHYTFSCDVNNHTFSLTGKNVYLQGLGSPVRVEIRIGPVLLSGVAYDDEASGSGGEIDVINGTKGRMPLALMMGETDSLRVDKAAVKAGRLRDSLVIKGILTVADLEVNLAQQAVTIAWGAAEIPIPAGKFVRVGNKHKFVYARPQGSTLPNATITLDWETGRFTMAIKQTDLAAQPRVLKVRFSTFDETVTVN